MTVCVSASVCACVHVCLILECNLLCSSPSATTVHSGLIVQFERSAYQVGEGDGVLDVAVVTNIAADFQVNFTIFARNGTATGETVIALATDRKMSVFTPHSLLLSYLPLLLLPHQPSPILISLVISAPDRAFRLPLPSIPPARLSV